MKLINLYLLWHQGLSVKEIARELDSTPKKITAWVSKARKKHPEWFPYRYKRLAKHDKSTP